MTEFNYNSVPLQGNCRWFVRRGATVKYNRGFRSKEDASNWIDAFGPSLNWRAGFTFQLKGDAVAMEIVNRKGERADASRKRQRRLADFATLASGEYLAKCRQTTAISAALNGHSQVWPEARMVIQGESATFFRGTEQVWECSMIYAANNFDVTPWQS